MRATPRSILPTDRPEPVYAVWELTLRCDHACSHCGSRAAVARPDELTFDEILDTAAQLIRLGTREVTLIGGEAYLHPNLVDVVRFLSTGGIRVTMQTGGRGFTLAMAKELKAAGMSAIGVSVDGPPDAHNTLRNAPGSQQAALQALDNARQAGLIITANSQVNELNAGLLKETAAVLKEHGVRIWRCQMTVPMGRAADRPEWILRPWRMLQVIDTLAEIQVYYAEQANAAGQKSNEMFNVLISNNLGYYGPHEVLLRSNPGGNARWWQGCQAGTFTLGIESDGTIKACPSLPTAPYVGGNVRDLSIEEIWENAPELQFVRSRTTQELWGFCKSCEYAETCMAGCSFTTHCTLGKRGNNPFCYHRAHTLKQQGKRETIVRVERAAGDPYDFGRFEIREEAWVDPAEPVDRKQADT